MTVGVSDESMLGSPEGRCEGSSVWIRDESLEGTVEEEASDGSDDGVNEG